MDAQQYNRISAPFRTRPRATKALAFAVKLLTGAFYLAYPVLLVILLASQSALAAPCLMIPAASFVLLSLVRKRIDAPRPYEALEIDPLISKDTVGESFPSRHAFSAALISMCWLAWNPPIGIALLVLACLLGIARVVGGVHFPKDVAAGLAIGVLCGLPLLLWM